jgi:hypothetical protein
MARLTKETPVSISTATSPTHYGHEVWQDEDGEAYYLAGHVPLRRAIAAANRYARVECGLMNLFDEPGPNALPGARHVCWKPAPNDYPGWEDGHMVPCAAEESGAEPFTEVYL